MRSRRLAGVYALLAATLLIGAQAVPATAAGHVSFGAKLDRFTQPTPAESCSQDLPVSGSAKCTWVAIDAAHNGGHEQAPKSGTIGKLSLVTCVGGSFVLQIARANQGQRTAKIVRSVGTIHYQADPGQATGNCGGDNGDQYIVQTFKINVHVNKGDYIAIKASKVGPIYNSGGTGVLLFHPTLPTGGPFKHANGTSSADLLISLQYS